MTDRKDREWLRRKLIDLLERASGETELDHPACAKYADLLMDLLPEGDDHLRTNEGFVGARVRQALKQAENGDGSESDV